MSTFSTHDVRIEKPRSEGQNAREYWKNKFSRYDWRTKQHVEQSKLWGCSDGSFIHGSNSGLVGAIGEAYNYHVPISLSPDAIWSVICHGFSAWINENAEAVRDQFVSHQGQVKLEIEVQPNPDWDRVMGLFSDLIADHIGSQRNLFINDFSETTRDARIGSEALLMYGMSKYFEYGMSTLCGFPSITLEGTPDDWRKISDRVRNLREYSLEAGDHLNTWIDNLQPVVDEFVRASEGNPDIDFWRSLYKEGGGSGGPYVSGHVTAFYPFYSGRKDTLRPNPFKSDPNSFHGGGVTLSSFPRNTSQVDVKWKIAGAEKDMVFEGGVLAIGYSAETNTIRPHVGWCVSETLVTDDESELY